MEDSESIFLPCDCTTYEYTSWACVCGHIRHEVAPPPPRTSEVRGGVRRGGKGGGYGDDVRGEVRGGTGGGYGGVWRFTHKTVHTEGGAYTSRCTQKAVCSHRMSLVV